MKLVDMAKIPFDLSKVRLGRMNLKIGLNQSKVSISVLFILRRKITMPEDSLWSIYELSFMNAFSGDGEAHLKSRN